MLNSQQTVFAIVIPTEPVIGWSVVVSVNLLETKSLVPVSDRALFAQNCKQKLLKHSFAISCKEIAGLSFGLLAATVKRFLSLMPCLCN